MENQDKCNSINISSKAELFLEKMYSNPHYTDLRIVFPQESITIKCHKSFLAENSEYWGKLLLTEEWKELQGGNEKEISIEYTESKYFRIFLKYCYLRKLDLGSKENRFPVLVLADKYLLQEMVEEIIEIYRHEICKNPLMCYSELLDFSMQIDPITMLINEAYEIILNDPDSAFKLAQFQLLSPKCQQFLQNLLKDKLSHTLEEEKLFSIWVYSAVLCRELGVNNILNTDQESDQESTEVFTLQQRNEIIKIEMGYINFNKLSYPALKFAVLNEIVSKEDILDICLSHLQIYESELLTYYEPKAKLKYCIYDKSIQLMQRSYSITIQKETIGEIIFKLSGNECISSIRFGIDIYKNVIITIFHAKEDGWIEDSTTKLTEETCSLLERPYSAIQTIHTLSKGQSQKWKITIYAGQAERRLGFFQLYHVNDFALQMQNKFMK